ncbi:MAG: amino acid-binding protein [Planctomycetes bacterium]|nr:amino acid-binding protein [Planctomycetota bacterium]
MPYTVNKVDMWIGRIEDQIGGLADKLEPLAAAGADLELVIARRQRHMPGKGVVFLGPLTGAKLKKAAEAAGLRKALDMSALRVEGPNKPGEGGRMMRQLAGAGLNLRGVSAMVLGNKFVAFLAFDNLADANKAARLLRGAGSKKT